MRSAFKAAATDLERMMTWSRAARTGDVSGPVGAISALLDQAAKVGDQVCPECRGSGKEYTFHGAEPPCRRCEGKGTAALDEARTRVGVAQLPYLLSQALTRGAWYVHGGGSRKQEQTDPRLVVAMAVRLDSLVVLGAKRAGPAHYRIAGWVNPSAAWPELGSWTTKRDEGSIKLSKPLTKRLQAWAQTHDPDRLCMDASTARAVALALFLEPIDKALAAGPASHTGPTS